MKIFIKVLTMTILAISMALVGCNKEQNNEPEEPATSGMPVVVTSDITEITNVSAICSGVVTSDGGHTVVERGVCYGTEHDPLVSGPHLVSAGGMGSYTVTLTGLEPNTAYYVRAYAINSVGIAYGDEVGFTTQEVDNRLPVVTMVEVTEVTSVSAIGNAMIDDEGNGAVFQKGFCWSEQNPPTIDDFCCVVIENSNSFSADLDLSPNTTYYVRAYAINGFGVGYSSVLSFTTLETVAPPIIFIMGGDGYLYDGQVVDVDVAYEYGFHMESTVGLASLAIRAEHSAGYLLFDGSDLDGALDYSFVGSVTFFAEREIVGECTFTAVVTDVNGQSSSASFTVYINQDQMLIPSPFEWCRYGANPGTGLEEFGLYWDRNSKDIYARIRPLDGVSLFYFDPTVWNEVGTEAEKAALFLSALEAQPFLYEYANVSATMVSADYDDVIGTVLPDGTMHLIHVTHCTDLTRPHLFYSPLQCGEGILNSPSKVEGVARSDEGVCCRNAGGSPAKTCLNPVSFYYLLFF